MAGRIQGITIEIDGNTTKLTKSLSDVNNTLRKTSTDLKDVNKLLKLNPGNIALVKQKQDLLKTSIDATKQKLEQEKKALAQLQEADESPEVKRQMEALERQIIEDTNKLNAMEKELAGIKPGHLDPLNAKLREIGAKAQQVGQKMQAVGQKMAGIGRSLSMYVTAPIVAFGTVGVKKFAEVDKIMTLTNSTMGNGAKEAALLNEAMKEAAANSTFGMQDAATATLNFARAGLSAKQAAAALAPAMALAAGAGGSLDTVSGGLVATINSFHGSFEDAASYADVFANACNNSALDVNSLSSAMSVAAPIFSALGYGVKDAALYMGIMANAGIDANKAATSLKTGMARLVDPSKSGAEWMKKLGIEVTNADGSMKDSTEIQKELHDAFGTLTESEQAAAAAAIFGKNQMSPWLALINTAPGDVDNLSNALDKEGTAMEMQEAQMSGFGGSLEKLKSGIDVAATSFGEALAPVISKVADLIQFLVDKFNYLSPQMQTVVATIALVVAAIGPVLVIIGTLISAVGTIVSAFGAVSAAIGGGGVALTALTGPIGIAIGVIAGLVAAGVLLYKNWDKIKAGAQWLAAAISAKFKQIKAFIITTWTNVKTYTQQAWNNIKSGVIQRVTALIAAAKQKITDLKTNIAGAWDAIKEKATTAWENIKTAVVNKAKSIVKGVKEQFEKIKDGIKEKLESAKKTAKEIIDKIKGFFKFEWKIPKPKVPKFTLKVNYKTLGGIKIPIPSITPHYAKAYHQPYLFSQPTMAGGAVFGDRNGDEMVYGRENLMRDISKAAGVDSNRLYEAVRQGASDANITMYVGERELGRVLRDMGVVFA